MAPGCQAPPGQPPRTRGTAHAEARACVGKKFGTEGHGFPSPRAVTCASIGESGDHAQNSQAEEPAHVQCPPPPKKNHVDPPDTVFARRLRSRFSVRRAVLISEDGATWVRFDESFELGIEPLRALLRGEPRLLADMNGAVVAGEGGTTTVPIRTELMRPFPNPFNPRVKLNYSLAKPGAVRLDVYDVKGRLVTTLVDETQPVGRYSIVWNGIDREGASVASGVYFARFHTESVTTTHRMVLVR